MNKLLLFILFLAQATFMKAQCFDPLSSPAATSWQLVGFSTMEQGWLIAEDAQVWRTANTGNTWQSQDPRTQVGLNDLSVLDGNRAWLVGDRGIIRQTSDGGNTWRQQFSPLGGNWETVAFANAQLGLVAGECGGLMWTDNGGDSWQLANMNTAVTIHALVWVNDQIAIAAGENGFLARSTNAGVSWVQLGGVGSSNHKVLAAKGVDVWLSGDGGTYYSGNAGQSWVFRSNLSFNSLAAVEGGQAIGCTPNGVLHYTLDTFNWPVVSSFSGSATAVELLTSTEGYVAGAGGELWRITWLAGINISVEPADCVGETAVLTGSTIEGGAIYTWTTPTGTTINGPVATVVPTGSGTYTYTVQLNGCQETVSTFLNPSPLPTLELGGNITLCEGESTLLTPQTNGMTYLWSTGSMAPQILVSDPGQYSLTVTNAAGCQSTDAIVVQSLPVGAAEVNLSICEGESVNVLGQTFNADNPSGQVVLPNGAANGCDSLVSVMLDILPVETLMADTLVCETDLPFTFEGVDIAGAGVYNIEQVAPNGCDQLLLFTVEVEAVPVSEENVAICEGETYLWDGDEYTETGTYEQTIATSTGCDSIARLNLEVYPTPSIMISDTLSDDGTGNGQITVVVNSGTPPYQYEWSNGAIGPVNDNLTGGTYSLTVTDANGCTDMITIELPTLTSSQAISNDFAFEVWPNPTEGTFTVLLPSGLLGKNLRLELYDSQGRQVEQWQAVPGRNTWSTTQPSGLYWLRLSSEQSVLGHKKLIIVKD
jgi:photosystem II stability/assembly factor-like uncharacterized protein